MNLTAENYIKASRKISRVSGDTCVAYLTPTEILGLASRIGHYIPKKYITIALEDKVNGTGNPKWIYFKLRADILKELKL